MPPVAAKGNSLAHVSCVVLPGTSSSQPSGLPSWTPEPFSPRSWADTVARSKPPSGAEAEYLAVIDKEVGERASTAAAVRARRGAKQEGEARGGGGKRGGAREVGMAGKGKLLKARGCGARKAVVVRVSVARVGVGVVIERACTRLPPRNLRCKDRSAVEQREPGRTSRRKVVCARPPSCAATGSQALDVRVRISGALCRREARPPTRHGRPQ